jgi:DNA invertase Pin-like site-specific DNA recombinase
VRTIDEDLGSSGVSADQRRGFQYLMAEIGLARVGLVISQDASRLARNNSDWYQLLELCSVFGTLMADSERLYDPRDYHDRLLLGLSGMMSEAELHHLNCACMPVSGTKPSVATSACLCPTGWSGPEMGRWC